MLAMGPRKINGQIFLVPFDQEQGVVGEKDSGISSLLGRSSVAAKEFTTYGTRHTSARNLSLLVEDCWVITVSADGPITVFRAGKSITPAQALLLLKGFDLRLMSSLNDVSGIPTEGKNLIIVAAVNNVLHFRIFDGDGKVVVDTDEKRLTEQARQIEDLRKQLESLWPPHELTRSDKGRVITAVTSIVGHILLKT